MKTDAEYMLTPVKHPPGFNPAELIAKANEEIGKYTALLVTGDGRISSGTLVNACGFYGILTAHHVAKVIFEFPEFAIAPSERNPTSLWPKSEHLQHVILGKAPESEEQNGPDLSFMIIRDFNLIETLRSLKSFYYLETSNTSYFNLETHKMTWAISGSPAEAKELIQPNYKGGPLTKLRNFVGETTYHSRTVRNDFDYIELKCLCGVANYPKNYKGVSGGGFWLLPMLFDSNQQIVHGAPILAGVAFYQTDPPVNSERIITGHGYDSIYTKLIQTLKELK